MGVIKASLLLASRSGTLLAAVQPEQAWEGLTKALHIIVSAGLVFVSVSLSLSLSGQCVPISPHPTPLRLRGEGEHVIHYRLFLVVQRWGRGGGKGQGPDGRQAGGNGARLPPPPHTNQMPQEQGLRGQGRIRGEALHQLVSRSPPLSQSWRGGGEDSRLVWQVGGGWEDTRRV